MQARVVLGQSSKVKRSHGEEGRPRADESKFKS